MNLYLEYLIYYNLIMSDKKGKTFLYKKRKNESMEYEEKYSDKERKLFIFRNNYCLIINIQKITDLFYIIERLNLPYFYSNKEKLYFNFDKNLDLFWSNKENKILYESETQYSVTHENFLALHENLLPENIKYYSDFCFSYYYFSEDQHELFINNLDEDLINKLKVTRNFDYYKIIKFYGPKKMENQQLFIIILE